MRLLQLKLYLLVYQAGRKKVQLFVSKVLTQVQKAATYGVGHRNWGDTKGEDCYQDVCVLLNKTTMQAYKKDTLSKLAVSTRNKLYVAITRAKGNVYLIDEEQAKKLEGER